jgi:hypothetical protein
MGDSYEFLLKPNLKLVQNEGENWMPTWGFAMSRWTVILRLLGHFAPFPHKIINATLKMKCVPGDSAQLLYWWIYKCLGKIWRTWPKFQDHTKTSKGLSPLARVLTMGNALDLFKMLIGECWWDLQGDGLGWPWFDPSQWVWPAIRVN